MKVPFDPKLPLGDLGRLTVKLYDLFRAFAAAINDHEDRSVLTGNGSPEGVVTANVGRLYTRKDGGAGTVLYVKESGTGNTGWRAV